MKDGVSQSCQALVVFYHPTIGKFDSLCTYDEEKGLKNVEN